MNTVNTVADDPILEASFGYDDFENDTVFAYLFSITDAFKRGKAERRMAKLAQEVGFKTFTRLFRSYCQVQENATKPDRYDDGGLSEFGADAALELNTGEWHGGPDGVWKRGGRDGVIWACSHPILPIQRLRGVDTGLIKVKLAFSRGAHPGRRTWNEVVVDAEDIASATKIVGRLASVGVSVTSGERANAMVDYLRDMIDMNEEAIPEVKSVSRMGWNEEGFSPYTDGIVFDSADTFRSAFNAIKQEGSFDVWLSEALDARSYSVPARIILAASFASALVQPLGCLPFFVHLWGMDSGTGKTVGQMLGASVWANPSVGQGFFQTFKGTSVGFEIMAGFLHSLPLFLDELQLSKDKHGNVVFNVYELASGSGKTRSNKALGLNYSPSWLNCFITSGETPLVADDAGAGAVNRVIEIECRAAEAVIKDGHRTANALKHNYGWAGRRFIEKLMEDGEKERAKELYDKFFAACTLNDTTGKQAMAAACILTADALATEWIFNDNHALTVDEISEFLKSNTAVSLADRGYDIICDWVAINASKLRGLTDTGECYGVIEDGRAYIIRSVFNRVCAENAINPKALLSHLKSKGRIDTHEKGFTKTRRFGSQVSNCVCLRLIDDDPRNDDFEDELPL